MASIVDEIRNDREKGAKLLESEYKAGLMSLARRFCADESDAEELVNRTFAIVVDRIDSYLEQSAFFAWMSRILVNCYSKDVRRKSNEMEFCDADIPEDAQDDDASARVFREVDASILRDAIDRLPKDMKQTLLLHYFMDMPVREVAKVLSVPSGTIMWRLHYARKILGAKLGATLKKPVVALVAAATFLMVGVAAVVGVVAEMVEGGDTEAPSAMTETAGTCAPAAADTESDPEVSVATDVPLSSTSTQKEETTMQTTSIGGLFRKALRSLAAIATTATMASASAVASTTEWTGDGANALNSTSYVKVMENSGPLAGTWTLTGITAWNGAAQVAFTCVSNRPYASGTLNSGDARLGEMPAGNYVQQLSVFNQWDGSRTRSYRVQLAQPVGGNDIYARVTAVTVSQEGENLVDYPDLRELSGDASKVEASHADNANLANFPVTKLKFKKQSGYVSSNGDGGMSVNTGVFAGPNTRIELDFQFTEIENGRHLFGFWGDDTSSPCCDCYIGADTVGNRYFTFICSKEAMDGTQQATNLAGADLGRHCVVVDFSEGNRVAEVWTDGVLDGSFSLSAPSTLKSPYPLTFFQRNYQANGLLASGNTPKMRVYGFRVYEAGTLVKNFEPCVKGGVAGFRETCSGTFHTGENARAGVAGGGIAEALDDPYLSTIANTNGIYTASGYAAGESLILNTGYYVKQNSRIELDYALLTPDWTTDKLHGELLYLLDAYGPSGHIYATTYGSSASKGGFYCMVGSEGWEQADLRLEHAYGVRRTLVATSNMMAFVTAGYTNITHFASEGKAVSGDLSWYTLHIGSYCTGKKQFLPMKIYGLKIYEGDAVNPVKDFRPMVVDGVPVLVDAVGGGTITPQTYDGGDSNDSGSAYRRRIAEAGGAISCADGSDEAYLEFPGTETGRIDTGYTLTANSCVEADFSIWNTYALASISPILLYQTAGTYLRFDAVGGNNNNYWWQYCDSYDGTVGTGDTKVSNERRQYIFDSANGRTTFKRGDAVLYNAEMAGIRTRSDGTGTLQVGYKYSPIRLYGLKISESGTEVRDYVPCVTNGVAGLYEKYTKAFIPLSGGKVSGKASTGADEFVTRPQPTQIEVDGAGTLSCFSAAAKSYEWYVDGEKIDGETGETLTINWVRQKPYVRTYSVVPVYEVFGESVRGKAAEATVEFKTNGMTVIIR